MLSFGIGGSLPEGSLPEGSLLRRFPSQKVSFSEGSPPEGSLPEGSLLFVVLLEVSFSEGSL